LVREASRKTRSRSVRGRREAVPVTLGYHGRYCVPRRYEPNVLDRWEKLKPLAFVSRNLTNIEAVNERFQVIAGILDEFCKPHVVAGALATASCGHEDCADRDRNVIKKFIVGFRNKFEKVLREIETVVGSETDD